VAWFWPFNTDRGEQGELYELDLSPPPMRQPDETHIAYRARLAEPDPRMTMLLQLRDARLRDIEPRRPKPSTEGIILPSIDQVMGKNIGRRVARIAKLRSALAARDDAVGVAPPQSGSVRAGDIDKLIAAGAPGVPAQRWSPHRAGPMEPHAARGHPARRGRPSADVKVASRALRSSSPMKRPYRVGRGGVTV
jgi:hypothetical protein